MANAILGEDEASCQSKIIHAINLNHAQWALFWRLMVVGSAIADDLIEIYAEKGLRPRTAELWKRLSAEFIKILDDDLNVYCKLMDDRPVA